MNNDQLQTIDQSGSVLTAPVNPWTAIIQQSVEKGSDIDTIQKFITLQREEEDRQADRAFKAAMSRLQGLLPEISKTGKAKFQSSKGIVEYNFDNLNDICNALRPFLIETGLSYSFKQAQDNGVITVKCTVSHALGHTESNQMSSAPDGSGTKNDIQAIASTNTYLQRYTLKAAFGISSVDDDGAASDGMKNEKEEKIKFVRWMATAKQEMEVESQKGFVELDAWYSQAISYAAQYNQSFVTELQQKYTELKQGNQNDK